MTWEGSLLAFHVSQAPTRMLGGGTADQTEPSVVIRKPEISILLSIGMKIKHVDFNQ